MVARVNPRFRAGTWIAVLGLALSFALSLVLKTPGPFTIVAPIAVGGKWAENVSERVSARREG